MSLNNVKAVGDDQLWKAEAEQILADLLIRIRALETNK